MAPRIAAGVVILLAPAALFASMAFGSVDIAFPDILGALTGSGDDVHREIVWRLRLPRALAAFACGALLALAGALLQVLLRNPLADPYLLGVSGGAATAALAAMLLGASAVATQAASFAGAALTALGIVGFALGRAGWNPYRVLLAGVALSSAFGAVISLLLTLAPASQVQGMLFWLFGDLSSATQSWPAWVVLACVAVAVQTQAMALNVLALGEDQARARERGWPIISLRS